MKKLLSIALAAAMTLSLGALAVSAEETAPATGMNATKYEIKSYANLIGEDSYGASCSYDNNEKFDASIETLKAKSDKGETTDVTSIAVGDADNYIIEWKGTMTAKEAGEYTLIARKIDNGFTMFVNGVKVYEYWGASHWFDGAEDRLVGKKSFIMGTDPVNVEIYFLELGGGDGLDVWATTTPSDTNSGANINDAFDFNLKQTTYSLPSFGAIIPNGVGTDGGNGAQCVPENQKYDATIDKLMSVVSEVETYTTPSFNDGKNGGDNYIVKYTGYMVPTASGSYTFGSTKMDNGFTLFIGETKVYEMWANEIWNDNGSGNTYGSSITLEADKVYPFVAYYLELGGGEGLEMTVKIDDAAAVGIDSAFTFYTVDPTPAACTHANTNVVGAKEATATEAGYTGNTVCADCGETVATGSVIPATGSEVTPPPTGDLTVLTAVVAVIAVLGTAVVVTKKRNIAE